MVGMQGRQWTWRFPFSQTRADGVWRAVVETLVLCILRVVVVVWYLKFQIPIGGAPSFDRWASHHID